MLKGLRRHAQQAVEVLLGSASANRIHPQTTHTHGHATPNTRHAAPQDPVALSPWMQALFALATDGVTALQAAS